MLDKKIDDRHDYIIIIITPSTYGTHSDRQAHSRYKKQTDLSVDTRRQRGTIKKDRHGDTHGHGEQYRTAVVKRQNCWCRRTGGQRRRSPKVRASTPRRRKASGVTRQVSNGHTACHRRENGSGSNKLYSQIYYHFSVAINYLDIPTTSVGSKQSKRMFSKNITNCYQEETDT